MDQAPEPLVLSSLRGKLRSTDEWILLIGRSNPRISQDFVRECANMLFVWKERPDLLDDTRQALQFIKDYPTSYLQSRVDELGKFYIQLCDWINCAEATRDRAVDDIKFFLNKRNLNPYPPLQKRLTKDIQEARVTYGACRKKAEDWENQRRKTLNLALYLLLRIHSDAQFASARDLAIARGVIQPFSPVPATPLLPEVTPPVSPAQETVKESQPSGQVFSRKRRAPSDLEDD